MYSRVLLSLLIVGSVSALQVPNASDQPPPRYYVFDAIDPTTPETTTPETTTPETTTPETTTPETTTPETTTPETTTPETTTPATTTLETTTPETTTPETTTPETTTPETTTPGTTTPETTTPETTTPETTTPETTTPETTTPETTTPETTTPETTTPETTTPETTTPETTTPETTTPETTTPGTTTPETTTPETTTPETTTTGATTTEATTTIQTPPTAPGCTFINTGPIQLHASMRGSCSLTQVSSTVFKLASPNYPSRYGRLERCAGWFSTKEPRYIKVTPVDVNINKDEFVFYLFNRQVTRMSDDLVGKTLTFPTSSLRMAFHAQRSHWGSKFAFNMEVVNSNCHQIILISDGAKCTLSVPNNYPPGTICEWWIRAPRGRRVLVKFSRFDVGDVQCRSDYLAIEEKGNKRYSPKDLYCGNNVRKLQKVISHKNKINILMNGIDGHYGGFEATYTVVR